MSSEIQYQIRIVSSFAQIDATEFDRLAKRTNPDGSICENPFVSHAYLSALEESGSATAETGWLGQHLLLETEQGALIGVLPCYLKNHSQGEYVFDHGWADAFYRAGGEYYPKLQCSIPFTPATGPRLLTGDHPAPEIVEQALLQGLKQLTAKIGASSAHITFLPENQWKTCGGEGFLLRNDRQFHWHNDNYQTFADFLASLSSRKRKNIRRERETALVDGMTIEHLTGDQLTEDVWDQFFKFYMDTGSRKWGQPYLTRKFYSLIGQRMADKILLIMVKNKGCYIAGAINFIGSDTLFGRHWGCVEDHPCLHFEVCYYQAIEYAIANKLQTVEAGAQGEHKLARGYVPVLTYSAHHIANRSFRTAVENYLENERQHVEMERKILTQHAPFKKSD